MKRRASSSGAAVRTSAAARCASPGTTMVAGFTAPVSRRLLRRNSAIRSTTFENGSAPTGDIGSCGGASGAEISNLGKTRAMPRLHLEGNSLRTCNTMGSFDYRTPWRTAAYTHQAAVRSAVSLFEEILVARVREAPADRTLARVRNPVVKQRDHRVSDDENRVSAAGEERSDGAQANAIEEEVAMLHLRPRLLPACVVTSFHQRGTRSRLPRSGTRAGARAPSRTRSCYLADTARVGTVAAVVTTTACPD